jgi:hypothetical protein
MKAVAKFVKVLWTDWLAYWRDLRRTHEGLAIALFIVAFLGLEGIMIFLVRGELFRVAVVAVIAMIAIVVIMVIGILKAPADAHAEMLEIRRLLNAERPIPRVLDEDLKAMQDGTYEPPPGYGTDLKGKSS